MACHRPFTTVRTQSEDSEIDMDSTIDALTFDLVDWLGKRERTCEEVMCIWTSARSRPAIWREAIHRGFVTTEVVDGRCIAKPTPLGVIEGELRREIRRTQSCLQVMF